MTNISPSVPTSFSCLHGRMAIELGLDQPPPPTCSEREKVNRTRTWLHCYSVDTSHAIQLGKIPMLSLDNYVTRNSRDWYKSSPANLPFDVHLCAYVQILSLMAEWHSTIAEGNHRREVCFRCFWSTYPEHLLLRCFRALMLSTQQFEYTRGSPRKWITGLDVMQKILRIVRTRK